jgi:ComF family protein
MAEVISRPLITMLHTLNIRVDMVVPVPLGRIRQKERGFNQVSMFTRPLALSFSIQHSPRVLKRVRETASQVGLSSEERKKNVKGAFDAVGKSVRGKKILIVDDVITTGATLDACAHALKLAGAEKVFGFSLARTILD